MPTHGTYPTISRKGYKSRGILVGHIFEEVSIIFQGMSETEIQYWIQKKGSIRKQLRTMLTVTDPYIEEKEKWRKFYQKHFSIETNFADLFIPQKPTEGEWRLLIIAQGLTLSQVYYHMADIFTCNKNRIDLDGSVTKNLRNTTTAYALWVRNNTEPDEKYLGKSTKQTDPDMKIGITLLERMIYGIVFFDETGNHLDVKGSTFCSGSLNSNGDVLSVGWFSVPVRVSVFSSFFDGYEAGTGIREAVC